MNFLYSFKPLSRSAACLKSRLKSLILVFSAVLMLSHGNSFATERPSVLICSSRQYNRGMADLEWLKELYDSGFEPDYLEGPSDFTWERIRNYDVLVLYGVPPEPHMPPFWDRTAPGKEEYIELVERFLSSGGGVFLMVATELADINEREMIEPWGARLLLEQYHESNQDKIRRFPHMRDIDRAVLIDQIADSPISDGVNQLWWPYMDRRFTSLPGPIEVSEEWQIVVRGSKTSYTEVPDPERVKVTEYPDAYFRAEGENEPALLAIREYDNGRIVLLSQWPYFSIGAGTQWLYDRHVLSQGFDGIPSDWEKMMHNSFRWLAEPAFASDEIGGYKSDLSRFEPPNRQNIEKTMRDAEARWFSKDVYGAQVNWDAAASGRVYRGLYGAQSSFSSGDGTVYEYAKAAREAGLDFLVFMEDFSYMNEENFRELEAECIANSGDDLLLIPGYAIRTNLGNRAFFYGFNLLWPTGEVLTGKNRDLLNVQYQDEEGNYKRDVAITQWADRHHRLRGRASIGYFDFREPTAPGVTDMRLFSELAVRFYDEGELVEDLTEEYLLSAQNTIPPRPISVNFVRSPECLKREVESGNALSYAQWRGLDSLMDRVLRYGNAYHTDNVFMSDGPIIHSWPDQGRVMTMGAESFVTSQEWKKAAAYVTSERGLAEIRVYDGARMVRRFKLNGEKAFKQEMYFARPVQQNLVLIAEDVEGGHAVSYYLRLTKEGSMGFRWCGDRINECGPGYLGKGPGMFYTARVPEIDAGQTWDGGPRGHRRPFEWSLGNHPKLKSNLGVEPYGELFNNLPLLETTDDQVAVVRSELFEVYDPRIPVINSWRTWGPIHPARLMHSTRRYIEFNRPAVAVAPVGHNFRAERQGSIVSIFHNTVTFRKDQEVEELRLQRTNRFLANPLSLVLMEGDSYRELELRGLEDEFEFRLERGDWFGFYSPELINSKLIINRGEPVRVHITGAGRQQHMRFYAELECTTVKEGGSFEHELLIVSDALDYVREPSGFIRLLDYLSDPDGMEVERGVRVREPGLISLRPYKGAAELKVRRLDVPLGTTLPVRVSDMNPRWSTGMLQFTGHTTGYYTDGRDVYTPVGVDSEGYSYASLYPDQTDWHIVIGHPVISDNPELIIEALPVKQSGKSYQWHVGVNNPTCKAITADFRPAMPLPGLDMSKQTLTIPAGGYKILVGNEIESSVETPEHRTSNVERPDFISLIPRKGEYPALRISIADIEADRIRPWQAGIHASFKNTLNADCKEPLNLRVSFDARGIEGASEIEIGRPYGGGGRETVKLGRGWQRHSVDLKLRLPSGRLYFNPVHDDYLAISVFEISNVKVVVLDEDKNEISENILKNGVFEENKSGWTGFTRIWKQTDEGCLSCCS